MAIVASFAVVRLFLWFGYFVPNFTPDSRLYFDFARAIAIGEWPQFAVRTPGYPLFLWLVLAAGNSITVVIIFQQLATVLAALMLFWALTSVRLAIWPLALLAAVGFASSAETAFYEMTLSADHLFAVCLVLSAGTLIRGIDGHDWRFLAGASSTMALAVYFRPAGLFLLVVWATLLLTLIWRGRTRAELAGFGLPLGVLLLALCTYNASTLGRFTVSPWGPANFAPATAAFWVESEEFPAHVNLAIANSRKLLSDSDRVLLEESWEPNALFAIYDKIYNPAFHQYLAPSLYADEEFDQRNQLRFVESTRLLNQIAFRAVRERPLQYVKFVYTNLWFFFIERAGDVSHYLTWIEQRYDDLFVRRTVCSTCPLALRRYMLREFETPRSLAGFRVGRSEADPTRTRVSIAPSAQLKLGLSYFKRFRTIYAGPAWSLALFLLLASLVFKLVSKRGFGDTELWIGSIVLMLIGAALVVSLVELGLRRYSYPTYFIAYMIPAMLACLFSAADKEFERSQHAA